MGFSKEQFLNICYNKGAQDVIDQLEKMIKSERTFLLSNESSGNVNCAFHDSKCDKCPAQIYRIAVNDSIITNDVIRSAHGSGCSDVICSIGFYLGVRIDASKRSWSNSVNRLESMVRIVGFLKGNQFDTCDLEI